MGRRFSKRAIRTVYTLGGEAIASGAWAVIDPQFIIDNKFAFIAVGVGGVLLAWFYENVTEFVEWKRSRGVSANAAAHAGAPHMEVDSQALPSPRPGAAIESDTSPPVDAFAPQPDPVAQLAPPADIIAKANASIETINNGLKDWREWAERIAREVRAGKDTLFLGSGLIDQSQKMTVAARATAEKKAFGHRS